MTLTEILRDMVIETYCKNESESLDEVTLKLPVLSRAQKALYQQYSSDPDSIKIQTRIKKLGGIIAQLQSKEKKSNK
jgi:hypothetical protein